MMPCHAMPWHSRSRSFTPWYPYPYSYPYSYPYLLTTILLHSVWAGGRAAEKPNRGPTIHAWASSELMSPVADLQGPRGFVLSPPNPVTLRLISLDPEPFFFLFATSTAIQCGHVILLLAKPPRKKNTSDSMTRRFGIPRIGLPPYSFDPLVGYLAMSPTRLTATCSPLGQLGRAVRQR
ncbi:hypothetical protein COCSADRAFT_263375 [Bipolaris sorokiniana ND90Pr]|nr:uncharacterized protein COCSADRAFT_263375 [Bipolaris sorokiniana ND90Pr]EMD59089.1 hypothetical protein COCSADRAFT_263375 [Bipolaris sorokiniana ND90Pr]